MCASLVLPSLLAFLLRLSSVVTRGHDAGKHGHRWLRDVAGEVDALQEFILADELVESKTIEDLEFIVRTEFDGFVAEDIVREFMVNSYKSFPNNALHKNVL